MLRCHRCNYLMSDSQLLFDVIKEQIKAISMGLSKLITDTEKQFLSIGSNLNGFSKKAEGISKQTTSLAVLTNNSNIVEAITGLKSIISRMQEEIKGTDERFSESISTLTEMRSMVSEVREPLESFKKIVKRLKVLSISTKIESSQLKHMEMDFMNLDGDVEKLSQMIDEKSTNILKNAESIDLLIVRALHEISKMEEKQQEKVKSILSAVELNMHTINEKNHLSAQTADIVSGEIDAVWKSIGEVIVSMQFHDITRQQIEHVTESFDAISERIGGRKTEIAHGKDNARDDGEKKVLIEMGRLFQLQKAQLENAKDIFVGAIDNTVKHLRMIVPSIFRMTKKAQEITGTTNLISSSLSSDVESGITMIISALKENARGNEELSVVIHELFDIVNHMSQWVDDIEEIDGEIELIAVNARIKAAHTGSEGAPLGVIAEAIQNLSIEAASEKRTMSGVLQNVMNATESMRADTIGNIHEPKKETDAIVHHLNSFLHNLRLSNSDVFTLSRTIENASRELADSIENAILEITIQQEFAAVIDNTVDVLGRIKIRLTDVVPDGSWTDENRLYLDGVEKNYTMQSERMIHKAYGTTGNMSLGQVTEAQKQMEQKNTLKDEFENNVELF